MKLLKILLPLVLLLSMLTGQTSKPTGAALDVRQMMTAAQFNKAGLQKLTPSEIEALNAWLYSYSLRLLVSTSDTGTPTGAVVESYIDGDFEGWDGETVFKLDNGQIWQQDSYAYTYHYSYHPKVLIYKDGMRYKMKVDGVDSTIEVKRLK
jgi:hypothetical protein